MQSGMHFVLHLPMVTYSPGQCLGMCMLLTYKQGVLTQFASQHGLVSKLAPAGVLA